MLGLRLPKSLALVAFGVWVHSAVGVFHLIRVRQIVSD